MGNWIKFILALEKKYDYVIDAYGKLESILLTIFTASPVKIVILNFTQAGYITIPSEESKVHDLKITTFNS